MPRTLLVPGLLLLLACPARGQATWQPHVRRVADFVLAQQTPQGCIADAPGGLRAHHDGAMARSLFAPAYAWRLMGRMPYRNGWRDGLKWLAAAADRKPPWAGTWRHAYAARPPHVALPTPPNGTAQDGRAFSSATALFAYHVALYTHYTGDERVAIACRPLVQAGLDFLLDHNRGRNDLFCVGWALPEGGERWERLARQRARDQADVYLGLHAGWWLLGRARYRLAASRLEQNALKHLFDDRRRAFGTAIGEAGKLVPPGDNPESYVTQGYLAWAFGPSRETQAAMKWLAERVAPDNSIRRHKKDPALVLPVAAFRLGASRVGSHYNDVRKTGRWLRDQAVTPKGGIREEAKADAPVRNDLAGWVVLAWLLPEPLPFAKAPPPRRGLNPTVR